MREITLQEYQTSEPYVLPVAERDLVGQVLPSVSIQPMTGSDGEYQLTPGSTVGAVEIGDLSVLIRPKMGIPRLLSLACYATGLFKPAEIRLFDFSEEDALPDVLALALASQSRRAFSRGLLHGYRTEEEALYTVRGRIWFNEQIRRRFGVPMPVEVRYDEFTEDILANRLVKAAAYRLGRMRLRSAKARAGVGWIAGVLDNVSPAEYPQGNVPAVTFNRLNEHYKGAVELARVILRHNAFEAERGKVRASGFLIDMNKLFQEFLTAALREELGVSERAFGESRITDLDKGGRVHLKPDLVWREGSSCRFVGDAKYKRLEPRGFEHADIYQMLAYCTAADLPSGLLVYADGESERVSYKISNAGKTIEVTSIDLDCGLDEVLAQVRELAEVVKAQSRHGRVALRAA